MTCPARPVHCPHCAGGVDCPHVVTRSGRVLRLHAARVGVAFGFIGQLRDGDEGVAEADPVRPFAAAALDDAAALAARL
jgi:hypothetical protein